MTIVVLRIAIVLVQVMLTGTTGIVIVSYLRISDILSSRHQHLSRLIAVRIKSFSTSNFHHSIIIIGSNKTEYKSLQCDTILFEGSKIEASKGKTLNKMCDNTSVSLAEAASDCAEHADWLYEHCSAREQYDYVQLKNFNESQDPDLLWRFGRACHCLYVFSSASKEEKAAAIRDGLKAAQKAVEIDQISSYAFLVSFNTIVCPFTSLLLLLHITAKTKGLI